MCTLEGVSCWDEQSMIQLRLISTQHLNLFRSCPGRRWVSALSSTMALSAVQNTCTCSAASSRRTQLATSCWIYGELGAEETDVLLRAEAKRILIRVCSLQSGFTIRPYTEPVCRYITEKYKCCLISSIKKIITSSMLGIFQTQSCNCTNCVP